MIAEGIEIRVGSAATSQDNALAEPHGALKSENDNYFLGPAKALSQGSKLSSTNFGLGPR